MSKLVRLSYSMLNSRMEEHSDGTFVLYSKYEELETDLKDSKFWQNHWKNESSSAKAKLETYKSIIEDWRLRAEKAEKQLEAVRKISLDSKLCWQDKHIEISKAIGEVK